MVHRIYFSGYVRKDRNTKPKLEDAVMASKLSQACEITGLTFYSEGGFITIIEGDAKQISAVFEVYSNDARFSDLMVMTTQKDTKRIFKDFRIGFREVDFSEEVPNAFLLTEETLRASLPKNPTSEMKILAQTFARVNNLCA